MNKLLEFLIKSIVNHPDEVVIEEKVEGDRVDFNLKANQEDLKLIIGRNGRTIKAIRNLLRTKAFQKGKRVRLTLEE